MSMVRGGLPLPKLGKYKQWKLGKHIGDGPVSIIKFSPCCRLLGVVFKKSVTLLSLKYSHLGSEEVLVYHSDFDVEDIKWSPNSKSLLIISVHCSYFVFLINTQEAETQSVYRIQQPPPVEVVFIDWTPNSMFVILIGACSVFSCVHCISDGSKVPIPSICVCCKDEKPLMSFSSDGKYLALITFHTCSYHIALLSTESWITLWMKKLELIMIRGLEWSHGSNMLVVFDSSKNLKILDLNGDSLQKLHYNDPFVSGFFCSIFSKNLLAATCMRENEKVNLILLYNLSNWQLSEVLEQKFNPECSHHFLALNKLSFSHCGNFLASTMSNDAIVVWDLKDCCSPCMTADFQSAVLQWHPRKAQLACSAGNQVLIWKCNQDGPVVKTKRYVVEAEVSPVTTLFWVKRNLVLQSSQTAVILVKNKKCS